MTEAEMKQRIEDLESMVGQAYQVVGYLLFELGQHHSAEGQRALNYFSLDFYDDDFLPWPRVPFEASK